MPLPRALAVSVRSGAAGLALLGALVACSPASAPVTQAAASSQQTGSRAGAGTATPPAVSLHPTGQPQATPGAPSQAAAAASSPKASARPSARGTAATSGATPAAPTPGPSKSSPSKSPASTTTPPRSMPSTTKRPVTTPPTTAAPVTLGGSRTGVATFYAPAAPGGACLTMTVPASRYTAAAGPADFGGGAACGEYVQVTGARGTILVKVDNLCPECEPGHLDLSNEAFAAIDDPVKGRVPITWRTVRNPAVSGGLVIRVKDGSSQWWLGLRIDNAGNALASVEVADGAGTFHALARQSWGWTGNNPGKGPFRVRVRDVYGQAVTVDGVVLAPDQDQRTSARLY